MSSHRKRVSYCGEKKVEALEAKLVQKNEVIAELLQERVQKKSQWGPLSRL
jgi:hypothetical protein